jgi:UDP-N-acetylmuramoyl-tripeptide--D-alanyl-D-alanine ligase
VIANIQDVARALALDPPPSPSPITGWSTDSRAIAPGDLFFALPGPNFDGRRFVEDAFHKGAAAAIIEGTATGLPNVFAVPNALAALETLAAWARGNWKHPVVAITGSAGKTTTKEVAAALLATAMPVGKTEGNLNNHIGLPLSILRLPDDARIAVLEIGMNHPGEIRHLAAIARPTIGVVTNAGFAHAEFFGSVDEVALAKRELIESLLPDGIAVLNADDARVAAFASVHRGRTLTFAIDAAAAIRPERVEYLPDGVRFRIEGIDFESCFVGRHGLMNLLAGLAVARAAGVDMASLVDAVRSIAPAKMRGNRLAHRGIEVLNDCYNSNPDAVRAMLDVLRAIPARRRFAVLGEMLELGRWSETLHRDVGRYAAECGISMLIGIRGAARYLVDEAVRSGLPAAAAFFFDDPGDAGAQLGSLAREGDAVLFKGSRDVHVEKALEAFLES